MQVGLVLHWWNNLHLLRAISSPVDPPRSRFGTCNSEYFSLFSVTNETQAQRVLFPWQKLLLLTLLWMPSSPPRLASRQQQSPLRRGYPFALLAMESLLEPPPLAHSASTTEQNAKFVFENSLWSAACVCAASVALPPFAPPPTKWKISYKVQSIRCSEFSVLFRSPTKPQVFSTWRGLLNSAHLRTASARLWCSIVSYHGGQTRDCKKISLM